MQNDVNSSQSFLNKPQLDFWSASRNNGGRCREILLLKSKMLSQSLGFAENKLLSHQSNKAESVCRATDTINIFLSLLSPCLWILPHLWIILIWPLWFSHAAFLRCSLTPDYMHHFLPCPLWAYSTTDFSFLFGPFIVWCLMWPFVSEHHYNDLSLGYCSWLPVRRKSTVHEV